MVKVSYKCVSVQTAAEALCGLFSELKKKKKKKGDFLIF